MAEFFLSESDLTAIRDLMRKTPIRPRDVDEVPASYGAPEVYVARSPDGGIPALEAYSGTGTGKDQPGAAFCYVYRIQTVGTGTAEGIVPIDGSFRRVINLSSSEIEEGKWFPVVRDKFGSWLAVGDTRGDETAFVTTVNPYLVFGRYLGIRWKQVGLTDAWVPQNFVYVADINQFAKYPGSNPRFGRRAVQQFYGLNEYVVQNCCEDSGEIGGSFPECDVCLNPPTSLCATVRLDTDCGGNCFPQEFVVFLNGLNSPYFGVDTNAFAGCLVWAGMYYNVDAGFNYSCAGLAIIVQYHGSSGWIVQAYTIRNPNYDLVDTSIEHICDFSLIYPYNQSGDVTAGWTPCVTSGSDGSGITIEGLRGQFTNLLTPTLVQLGCDCNGVGVTIDISSDYSVCDDTSTWDIFPACCDGDTMSTTLYLTLSTSGVCPELDGLTATLFMQQSMGQFNWPWMPQTGTRYGVTWMGGFDDAPFAATLTCGFLTQPPNINDTMELFLTIYLLELNADGQPEVYCVLQGLLASGECNSPLLQTYVLEVAEQSLLGGLYPFDPANCPCTGITVTATITETP